MKKYFLFLVATLALSAAALAETWKDVPMVDTMCSAKVKANPEKHTAKCALKCADSGFGIVTSDGAYLKFDETGNTKAVAALKATKKTDNLRVTVSGELSGDTIKVASLSMD